MADASEPSSTRTGPWTTGGRGSDASGSRWSRFRNPLPWRTASWVSHPFGIWDNPADDERGRQWVRDARADVSPWSVGLVYLNFVGNEGEDRVVAGFGAENYRRLAEVKSRYDPDNVFRLNHNIRP